MKLRHSLEVALVVVGFGMIACQSSPQGIASAFGKDKSAYEAVLGPSTGVREGNTLFDYKFHEKAVALGTDGSSGFVKTLTIFGCPTWQAAVQSLGLDPGKIKVGDRADGNLLIFSHYPGADFANWYPDMQNLTVYMKEPERAEPASSAGSSLGKPLLSSLGKPSSHVLKTFGKGEVMTLKEFKDYLAPHGADEAISYYGKEAMPDDYLKGLDYAVSITFFFKKNSCFIGLNGVRGKDLQGSLRTLEQALGLAKGKLKVGKLLLTKKGTTKTYVQEVTGGPVKIYVTSWNNRTEAGTIWLSKTALDPKHLTMSI